MKMLREENFDLTKLAIPGGRLLTVFCLDPRFIMSLVERFMWLGEEYKDVAVYPAILPGFAMGMSDNTDKPNYRDTFEQTMEVVKPTHVVLITHVEENGESGCRAAHTFKVSDEDNLKRTVAGAQCIRNRFEVPVTVLVLVPMGFNNNYTLQELIAE